MAHTGYDPALVVLSVAIAVFASYVALDLGARIERAARTPRWAWVAGAALALGIGIWSMHFVGMLAFEAGMPVSYDLPLTALSLAIAVGVTGAGFAWVSLHGTAPRVVLVSGPLTGLGIAGMHYTGMAAMRMPGAIAYDPALVALSLAIAVTAATAALWLAFRPIGVAGKVLAATVMGAAVAGMHYTGMAAASLAMPDGVHAGAHGGVHSGLDAAQAAAHAALTGSQQTLALYVAAATFGILFLAMLASSIDQQHVQADLAASEARFRAAVSAVRGVLWTNDADGRMVGEQPGWAAITGQSVSEYQGYGWADAVHPDDAAASVAAWNETVCARSTFVFEHRVRSRDGAYRHYAIRGVPVLDAHGAIREWVGVHTDITEQREAEAELRESNEEIQRYAYIVSHDLRSPLVNVMGFTSELEAAQVEIREALRDDPRGARIDADLGEALGFIRAAVTRMESLIAAVLRLSREGRRTFRPERLDMGALLKGLADAQRHQTEEAGATITIAPDLPSLHADRLAVEQIFGNLLDNALKYRDPARPGRITVSAGREGGGRLRFDVSDNGRGIAERDHQRVFELFRRAGAQDRPGEGIGLAHVKALVRSLGGRIALTSQPGVGSTFSVTLPRETATGRGEDIEPTRLAAQ